MRHLIGWIVTIARLHQLFAPRKLKLSYFSLTTLFSSFIINPKVKLMKNECFAPANWQGLLVALIFITLGACSEEPISVSQPSDDALSERISAMSMHKTNRMFTARLTGDAERPVPVDSDGSGHLVLKLAKDGMSLSYKLIVNNLEGITQAHIHCGGPEVAGPPIAFLFGFDAAGVTENGVLAEGTITAADVLVRPDSQERMGGVANFEQLLQKIISGDAYVNVHTLAFPGGEIRGQIETHP